ncbi:hypothetical protein HPB50_000973 [Hyalomma asiaticum]|uniref:Uncharacterized protein n=1 Tax=Hyalomma asiaticum TaxID=266040 RepID=A0ACB7TAK7_HYAAI|nr:hypothetical protein HPB50_000973 [Hyalomma asiaticum]
MADWPLVKAVELFVDGLSLTLKSFREIKRHDSLLQELEKKQEAQRDAIHKLEQHIQQSKAKSAGKM